MSTQNWLEDMSQRFDQAIYDEEWEVAETIIKEVEDAGEEVYAVMRRDLERAKVRSGEV